ncbi:hypothetical protein ONR75_24855 [Rhodopseudomonas sp. P2A-2r]|uniref:hypothetical protein n=1 Tax=Rhodopseudomonas sp. P2A-2r TaxID=2991972 RepID=UPI002234C0D6|nr:hypothetical protein [Rhodopseudomonas sp. P2A-2r]UZE48048.1 hypothetical protein ONR75_24855 [Rhodopseudomonas sp. P2A-2r]
MSNAGGQDVVAPRSVAASGVMGNSPLVNYALSGLQKCWLPDKQRWSHIYHLDGRENPNESVPHSDVFYSLNVLLGMSRIRAVPQAINIPEVFSTNVDLLTRLPVPTYAFGMALWAAAKLKLEVPFSVSKVIRQLLENRGRWTTFRAQDLGMLLIGIVAQAVEGRTEFSHHAALLFNFLSESYATDSALFCDTATGFRRRFASFATQTYLAIACYSYGEFAGEPEAIELANSCVRRLIELQGPQGEWPWFFDAKRGEVVDFYEVYSVHQYGMAPALLEFAERHNVEGATKALVKGFNWIFGENQLRRSMLLPASQLSYRSQVRVNELHSKDRRVVRAVANAYLGRKTQLIPPASLTLRMECRSYELGWILWSFGERYDLDQLTHNLVFSSALR